MNDRFIVLADEGCIAVFIYEHDAEIFVQQKKEDYECDYEIKEIDVEDIHEYI